MFVQLGNLCDKIAGYALRIAEETEKSFIGLQRALNSHNSIISHNMKYYLEEDRKAHR